jgi:REP-associated tyrosine transposase
MPRIARVAPAGHAFHVTHRGNRRDRLFLRPGDERRYLHILAEDAARRRLGVWAYCLMPNHVHLIVMGEEPHSLSRAIGNAHRRYARRVNEREGWTGHLWAGRFYSTILDESHLWAAVRYVETNPVRAGLTRAAPDYPWSSARAHVGNCRDPILAAGRPFPGNVEDWAGWLMGQQDPAAVARVRSNTMTGRPYGSVEFVRAFEVELGRRVEPRPRGGRPLGQLDIPERFGADVLEKTLRGSGE